MAVLEIITGLFSSAAGGGLVGMAGAWLTTRAELSKMKVAHAHEARMAEIDMKATAMEIEASLKQAEITADQAKAVSADALMSASISAESTIGEQATGWVGGFLALVRGLIRPIATLYAMVILTVLTVWVFKLAKDYGITLTAKQVYAMMTDLINTITFLSVTILLWWFGVRYQRPK